MKLTKIASVFLAVLLVASAGVAAMPGNAPADSQAGQADDHHSDDGDAPAVNATNASEDRDEQVERTRAEDHDNESATNASADERRGPPADADQRRGPPTDMPAQVPDFVTQIHDLVGQKLDGTVDHLGQMIADVTPGDHAGQSDHAHDSDQSGDGQSAAEQGSDAHADQQPDTADADDGHSED